MSNTNTIPLSSLNAIKRNSKTNKRPSHKKPKHIATTPTPLSCITAIKRTGSTRPTPPKDIDLVITVDTSGSMRQFSPHNIVTSINEFIDTQKKLPVATTISITKFSTNISTLYDSVPINSVKKITYDDIRPTLSTSLYDAFSHGLTILSKTATTRDKILVVITDGVENTSVTTKTEVMDKIKEGIAQEVLIKYLGGGQDAIKIGLDLGIAEDSCLSFSNDNYGLGGAMIAASNSVGRHTSGLSHGFTGLERVASQSASQSNTNTNTLPRTTQFNHGHNVPPLQRIGLCRA